MGKTLRIVITRNVHEIEIPLLVGVDNRSGGVETVTAANFLWSKRVVTSPRRS